jgi:hypothetical protein
MPAKTAAARNSNSTALSGFASRPHYLLLFALIFAALMLLHAPLLRLPYFWDEAGYYVPAARDLYVEGTLIPHSTVSNAHPPLVMAWLALAWRMAGFSPLVTRTAMLALAAFALLGLFQLTRFAANVEVALATITLVAVYPVFFSQSSLAHLDVAAAGLTFWGLLAWVEDRPIGQAVWFSLAALTKETAILAPVALFGWEIVVRVGRALLPANAAGVARAFLPATAVRKSHPAILIVPLFPLACWYGFHYAKTGYLLGNPEFYRYNVAATVDVGRIPFALAIRLWQVFGYFGLYLLTLAGLLAMTRKAQRTDATERPRIAIWMQGAFFSVLLAYILFMSVIGGAVLARYMLPVAPVMMVLLISTLWRRVRYWALIVAAIAIVFVTGLFHNPPYGYSLEDNLAYRDFIVLHTEAIHFLEMRFPDARVLTAWPTSDELNRPWLGYVSRPLPVVRIEDFSSAQIMRAAAERNQFDVALVFSTKYEPEHPMLENWDWWQHIKERYFGYHRDLNPEEIAGRLGGRLLFQEKKKGLWATVIEMERGENAQVQTTR